MTASVGSVVRTAEELEELIPEWQGLYGQSEPHNPFLSAEWTKAYLNTVDLPIELFVVTLRSGSRLVGIAPLCIERRAGFRVLQFISEDRSDYLGFLCASDHPAAAQELIDEIVALPEKWDLAVLKRLTADYSGLSHVGIPASAQSHNTIATTSRYTAADVDWDELHEIGPRWLKRTRKRLPRFLRDGWILERFTGAEAAARLDLVSEVEARSWKARQNLMRLQPGAGQELLRRAFETLGMRGEMQLWMAFLDGRPGAYRIDFILPKQVWIYQLGYDQEFHRASVGSFLGYAALKDAWSAGIREYDFLSGDEPYKAERTIASRTISDLAIHPRTTRGRAAYVLLIAPRWYLKEVPVLRTAFRSAMSLVRAVRRR